MKLATTNEAAVALGISAQLIRSGIKTGRFPCLHLGSRMMVDLDQLRDIVAKEHEAQGISIEEVSELTGLRVTSVRRGVRAGWIPAQMFGGKYLFQPEEVLSAIKERMSNGTKR